MEKKTRVIKVSEVLNDLRSGLTWSKKEDLGFGSLEKKYNLNNQEIKELSSHPKIRGVETRIPSIFIIDDTVEDIITETKIEVGESVVVEVKAEVTQPTKKIEAFI